MGILGPPIKQMKMAYLYSFNESVIRGAVECLGESNADGILVPALPLTLWVALKLLTLPGPLLSLVWNAGS